MNGSLKVSRSKFEDSAPPGPRPRPFLLPFHRSEPGEGPQDEFLEDHGFMIETDKIKDVIDPHASYTLEYIDMIMSIRANNFRVRTLVRCCCRRCRRCRRAFTASAHPTKSPGSLCAHCAFGVPYHRVLLARHPVLHVSVLFSPVWPTLSSWLAHRGFNPPSL